VFSRLMVQKPNVLVLDEPTNHLDLESIEALVEALDEYEGTLIFVSHDRWFVERVATRVIEITADGLNDFAGTYAEFLERQGDDHLDANQVELRAKAIKASSAKPKPAQNKPSARNNRQRELPKRRDDVLARISVIEARLGEIDTAYCAPGFFDTTPPNEIEALQKEKSGLESELEMQTAEWESLELEIASLES
jgi:energy-coupling factor transporter ATP-binding protein EcfA2